MFSHRTSRQDPRVLAAHVREVPDVVEPVHPAYAQHSTPSNFSMNILRLP